MFLRGTEFSCYVERIVSLSIVKKMFTGVVKLHSIESCGVIALYSYSQ